MSDEPDQVVATIDQELEDTTNQRNDAIALFDRRLDQLTRARNILTETRNNGDSPKPAPAATSAVAETAEEPDAGPDTPETSGPDSPDENMNGNIPESSTGGGTFASDSSLEAHLLEVISGAYPNGPKLPTPPS